jgi:hypothetical protein
MTLLIVELRKNYGLFACHISSAYLDPLLQPRPAASCMKATEAIAEADVRRDNGTCYQSRRLTAEPL